jgi:hypothetical protein
LIVIQSARAWTSSIETFGWSALDRHPEREGLDLLDRDVRVEADAALRRAERAVPAAAVGREVPRRAVVHADGERGRQAFPRVEQGVDHLGVHPGLLADPIDAGERILKHVELRHVAILRHRV